MKWTIKFKLVAIGIAAVVAMSGMLFLFVSTSSEVDKADDVVAAELVYLFGEQPPLLTRKIAVAAQKNSVEPAWKSFAFRFVVD